MPLQAANTRYSKRKFAGVVLVSDNQSWVYQHQAFAAGTNGSTGLMTQWNQFLQNQKRHGQWSPKQICIDLQPLGTTQAPERDDILNIGGFSDAVFNVIAAFLGNDTNRFVAEIEAIEL